jgi:hypothetical protein
MARPDIWSRLQTRSLFRQNAAPRANTAAGQLTLAIGVG